MQRIIKFYGNNGAFNFIEIDSYVTVGVAESILAFEKIKDNKYRLTHDKNFIESFGLIESICIFDKEFVLNLFDGSKKVFNISNKFNVDSAGSFFYFEEIKNKPKFFKLYATKDIIDIKQLTNIEIQRND